MSTQSSVSASRLDPLCRKWWVRVGEGTYGPYTGRQIRDFITERRIVPRSVIRPVSGGSWRRACDDEILGVYFPASKKLSQSRTNNVNRKMRGGAGALRRILTDEEADPTPRLDQSGTEAEKTADVLVFASADAVPDPTFEQALNDLGAPIRILGNAWLLKTGISAQEVREQLGPVLGRAGQLVVVDVTRQQTATLNLGSDLDVQIRQRLDTFA